MTPVKASSFGHRIGFCRRYPGGRRERSIVRTVSRASPQRRAAPPHTRCAAPPHRAPLDTSLRCSTQHPRNARWTTRAVWFSAALRRLHTVALWFYFCSAVLTSPEFGERQHQPHQVRLPREGVLLVDPLQVPVDGVSSRVVATRSGLMRGWRPPARQSAPARPRAARRGPGAGRPPA